MGSPGRNRISATMARRKRRLLWRLDPFFCLVSFHLHRPFQILFVSVEMFCMCVFSQRKDEILQCFCQCGDNVWHGFVFDSVRPDFAVLLSVWRQCHASFFYNVKMRFCSAFVSVEMRSGMVLFFDILTA